jgi:hypothetical protein
VDAISLVVASIGCLIVDEISIDGNCFGLLFWYWILLCVGKLVNDVSAKDWFLFCPDERWGRRAGE